MRLAVCCISFCAVIDARAFASCRNGLCDLFALLVFDVVLELRIIQFRIRTAKRKQLFMRALLNNVTML